MIRLFNIQKFTALIFTLIFIAACNQVNSNKNGLDKMQFVIQSQNTNGLTVVLNVFSGRPNPTWKLSSAEAKRLSEIAVMLPAAEKMTELPSQLGYQGFLIMGDKNFAEIAVFQGMVKTDRAQWDDIDRKMELFLLSTSKPHIASNVYDMIVAEIQP